MRKQEQKHLSGLVAVVCLLFSIVCVLLQYWKTSNLWNGHDNCRCPAVSGHGMVCGDGRGTHKTTVRRLTHHTCAWGIAVHFFCEQQVLNSVLNLARIHVQIGSPFPVAGASCWYGASRPSKDRLHGLSCTHKEQLRRFVIYLLIYFVGVLAWTVVLYRITLMLFRCYWKLRMKSIIWFVFAFVYIPQRSCAAWHFILDPTI